MRAQIFKFWQRYTFNHASGMKWKPKKLSKSTHGLFLNVSDKDVNNASILVNSGHAGISQFAKFKCGKLASKDLLSSSKDHDLAHSVD